MANTKKKTHQVKLKIRIPHVIIDGRDADPNLLDALVPGLEELEARVRVLGDGAKDIPHAFSVEEAMEEGHIWVVLSKNLPSEFPMLIERGIVPVMLQNAHTKGENYNAIKEYGNSFIFPRLTEWHVYGSLVRALENFAFPHDWNNLVNQSKELLD